MEPNTIFHGVNVLNMDYINLVLPYFHKLVRGCMYVWAVLYNYRQIMRLIGHNVEISFGSTIGSSTPMPLNYNPTQISSSEQKLLR